MNDKVFLEAKRLYDLGFPVLWIRKNSKAPVHNGWSSAREDWTTLEKTYRKGFGVGCQTGRNAELPSGRFLAMIDLDLKSRDMVHRNEAKAAFIEAFGEDTLKAPCVESGNGRRYLLTTREPIDPFKGPKSSARVKVFMPSLVGRADAGKVDPSVESGELTQKDFDKGWRIRPAWEIDIMGTGRQGVLPPSLHPDTDSLYVWKNKLASEEDLPRLKPSMLKALGASATASKSSGSDTVRSDAPAFEPVAYNLFGNPNLSDDMIELIQSGQERGTDGKLFHVNKSDKLYSVCMALMRAGFSDMEILTILTDKDNVLGQTAYAPEHRNTKNRRNAAQWVYQYTLLRARKEVSGDRVFEGVPIGPTPKLNKEKTREQVNELTQRPWKNQLKRKSPPKGADDSVLGPVLPLIENITLIIENTVSPIALKRNEFKNCDNLGALVPWDENARIGDEVKDDDIPRIQRWLSTTWGFEPTKTTVEAALTCIATDNKFHPIKDYYDNLPAWDGKPRLDTFLADYFGCEEEPEYLAALFRKWMLAAVWRIYEPGAQFDHMLVLQGEKGLRKSTFGRVLFGDEYFTDDIPELKKGADAALALGGNHCVEFSELSHLRRDQIDIIKAFITRRIDKIRPPYGRRFVTRMRSNVLLGTVNDENFLVKDSENDRRFQVVVALKLLDIKRLERERDQLWAEALQLYRFSSERIYLSRKHEDYASSRRKSHLIENDSDAMVFAILEAVRTDHTNNHFDGILNSRLSVHDLFREGWALQKWRGMSGREVSFATAALKKIGFEGYRTKTARFWKLPREKIIEVIK